MISIVKTDFFQGRNLSCCNKKDRPEFLVVWEVLEILGFRIAFMCSIGRKIQQSAHDAALRMTFTCLLWSIQEQVQSRCTKNVIAPTVVGIKCAVDGLRFSFSDTLKKLIDQNILVIILGSLNVVFWHKYFEDLSLNIYHEYIVIRTTAW
jgi:hypothetical protein